MYIYTQHRVAQQHMCDDDDCIWRIYIHTHIYIFLSVHDLVWGKSAENHHRTVRCSSDLRDFVVLCASIGRSVNQFRTTRLPVHNAYHISCLLYYGACGVRAAALFVLFGFDAIKLVARRMRLYCCRSTFNQPNSDPNTIAFYIKMLWCGDDCV